MTHPRMDDELNPVFWKQISIVFSVDTLNANLQILSDTLKDIALSIDTETDLITQDNLARGELVEAKMVSAFMREGSAGNKYWSFNLEPMDTPVNEIDDVEYWGKRWHYETDFICSTSHYPWMPSSVSEDEIPF